MQLGDTYEYDLAGKRTMDQDVPQSQEMVESDTMRVWTTGDDAESVYIEAGRKMHSWARRQGITITDTRDCWYAMADALRLWGRTA